jgi:hypothetical protein
MSSAVTGTGQQQEPIASKLTIAIVSLEAGLGVGIISYAVERWLEVPPSRFLIADLADQAISGIATALAIYLIWIKGRRAQLLDRQRFELISASTQQIRDALQLITNSAVPGTPQQGIIIYAVDHIEWVLQEVLPAVHQKPKEVAERIKKYAVDEPETTLGQHAVATEKIDPSSNSTLK